MARWNVELSYGIGFSIDGVDAVTKSEAIRKARDLITDETTVMTPVGVSGGDLDWEECECIWAKQKNGKWDLEFACGVGFSVDNVEAGTRNEAIEKAARMAEGTSFVTNAQVDAGDLEYDQCTYVEMAGIKKGGN